MKPTDPQRRPTALGAAAQHSFRQEVSRPTWLLQSRRRVVACSLGGGALVFCGAFFTERYFADRGAPTLPMVAGSDVLVGLLATLLILRVAYDAIERRETIVERLNAIGEIHHHIRNGLAALQFSAYSTEDKRALAAIRDSMDRIEWTLREILGPNGPLADTSDWRKNQEARHGAEMKPG